MTEKTQPVPTGAAISADDQRDIRVAMNALPYAADLRVPIPARGELPPATWSRSSTLCARC